MIKTNIITTTVEVETRICDVCSTDISKGKYTFAGQCVQCNDDLCKKCVGHEDSSTGDYIDLYCKRCWDLGEQYRKEIEPLESQIDALNDEWDKKCKTRL